LLLLIGFYGSDGDGDGASIEKLNIFQIDDKKEEGKK
jgi:hypothetical protein